MNLFMLFFKSKVAPAGAESAHHLPESGPECLIKMHSLFSTLWLAQLNCIEQAYVCTENKGSGGKWTILKMMGALTAVSKSALMSSSIEHICLLARKHSFFSLSQQVV